MSKTVLLLSPGALLTDVSPSGRYYFLPNSSGSYVTESQGSNPLGIVSYPGYGNLFIHHDGHPITFPKIRVASGGLKITGTGFETGGTRFFNETGTNAINVKSVVGGAAFLENSPSSKLVNIPGVSGYYLTDSYSGGGEGYTGSGTLVVTFDATGWTFPKIRTGSGGIKVSGDNSGTRFYTDLIVKNTPYIFTYLNFSEIYGQSDLKSPYYLIPNTGSFLGEDIEGPSGLLLSGTGSYYKVQKITYNVIPGVILPGGTTDRNQASNRPVQLPSILGGLRIISNDFYNDAECIWIRKYAWIGSGYFYVSGPNNIFSDLVANFHSNSYLKRLVPGEINYTGSGALFWAWDDIANKPKNTNFLIKDVPLKVFGNEPTTFTWSVKFKLDSRLQDNIGLNEHIILASMIISDEPDFPPYYGTGSVAYLGITQITSDSTQLVFSTYGSGTSQFADWGSSGVFLDFDVEYRLVLNYDSTQLIEFDRIKIYLNGVKIPSHNYSVFPDLNDHGYSNKSSDYEYSYHGIGGTYLTAYGYGGLYQFLGTITESIFLDGLIKTDSELYSSSYTGPYGTKYSYHLKYLNHLNLGYDSSGNNNNFSNAPTIEDIWWVVDPYYWSSETNSYVPYDEDLATYQNVVMEPVYFAGTSNFSSYLNSNRFTLNFDVYLPDCIRNYLNFDQWSTQNENPKGSQALRSISNTYEFTNSTRFTIGCRFLVDSRYEFRTDYTNGAPLTLLALRHVSYDETYDDYYDDGSLVVYLVNSADYDGTEVADSRYKGVSLCIEGCGNCNIQLPAKFIQVNTLYRLVIQVDTNSALLQDRVKVFLNDIRVDENNVILQTVHLVEEPPDSNIFIRVLEYGFPNKGEKLHEYYYRHYGTYLGSYISIGSEPVGQLYYTSVEYNSFLGTLGEIIVIDDDLVDSDVLLPISGYYSGDYGTGLGTFHYKFNSDLFTDSGPNNYTLEEIGSDFLYLTSVNENKNKTFFAIQNTDGYTKEISQYYRFGLGSLNTGYYLGYEAVGSITASVNTSTSLIPNTWYRIQISVDTSLPVAQNRVKFYVNKNLQPYFSGTHIPQNTNLYTGSGILYTPYTVIGNLVNYDNSVVNKGFTGIIKSPLIYLDGLVVEPSFFDPLLPPVSYGGYGFKLDFSDVDNLGYDSAPSNYDFINQDVFNVIDYENSYDFGKALGFIIYRDTTPISDILLPFKLISSEAVELVLVFEIRLDPQTITLPFKLYGEGQEVELILPFKLLWTSNFDSGSYSTTNTVTAVYESSIPLTYENLANVLVTDTTNTLHYEFGTSATDPNSKNGWIDIITGKIYISPLEDQYNKGASNVIYSGSEINVHYDYNLSQSTLLWQMTCSAGQLIGDISVEYEEDASTIAKFTLLPPSGEVDPLEYIGSTVTLDVAFLDSAGNSYPDSGGRVFTGLISEVEWDADLRVINVTADTQMPSYFNALTREQVEEIIGGIWSDQVWDNEDDSTGWTYAQERLSTTENTIWHDKNWTLRINSFRTSTPTLTFTDDERFHETLKLEFAQRSEMINQIRINMDYKYPRRRERKIRFRWTDHSNGLINSFLCGGNSYQLCQRSMVEGAATGSSWIPITKIQYTPIWPAQVVQCGSGMYDYIVWGIHLNEISTPRRDDNGNWEPVVMVNADSGSTKKSSDTVYAEKGPNGTTTYYEGYQAEPGSSQSSESVVPEEVINKLCIGATWTSARRWLQDVTEYYEMTVQCQDSIDTIGVVATSESYSIDSNIQDTEWEDSITPYKDNAPSGYKVVPGPQDKYWDMDEDPENDTENIVSREDFELAQEVVLAAAKVDILKAHRLTTVSFKIPYNSTVDLDKTVSVSTPYLSATGKIKILKHQFSIDTGEATTELFLAISRHNGSGLYEDDPLEPIEKPDILIEDDIPTSVSLNNYVGGRNSGTVGFTGKWYDGRAEGTEDPDNEGEWIEEPWEGFMTNYESPMNTAGWVSYMTLPSMLVIEAAFKATIDVAAYTIPYQFIVKGPDIDESHTTSTDTQAEQTFNVIIPVDQLELYA